MIAHSKSFIPLVQRFLNYRVNSLLFSSVKPSNSTIMRQLGAFNPQLFKDYSNEQLIPIIQDWGSKIAHYGVLTELRYKLLKFVSLRQEIEQINPSSELLSLARNISLTISISDPENKQAKDSYFKYKTNLESLYRNCYFQEISHLREKQAHQLDKSQMQELFSGVLLNCEILAALQVEELEYLTNLLVQNIQQIQTAQLMTLALQLSSLHSLRPVSLDLVMRFVNQYIRRAQQHEISREELLLSFKQMLKLTRNLKSKTQELSHQFSELIRKTIPQTPENLMEILALEHEFQSSIFIIDTSNLKEVLLNSTDPKSELSIRKLNILFFKDLDLIEDEQILNILSKILGQYQAKTITLEQMQSITELLQTINKAGVHDESVAFISSLFSRSFLNQEIQPIIQQHFIFKRLSEISGEIELDPIEMLMFEQKNNKNRSLILKFMDEVIRASFMSGVIDPSTTRSPQFKTLEFFSKNFMKLAHNKEDQITFQINLAYILVAYQNYLSPIWSRLIGSLIATYQLKNKSTQSKLYLVFKALEHYLNTDFTFFLAKFNRQVKQNLLSIEEPSKSLHQRNAEVKLKVKKLLEEKQGSFFENHMIESQVDFFIPHCNLAILVDCMWRGDGLSLEQRVLRQVLKCRKVELVVFQLKKETELETQLARVKELIDI